MWKKWTRTVAILVLVLFLVTIGGQSRSYAQEEFNDAEYLQAIMELIESRYVHEVSEDKLMEGALKGLFSSLDQYSQYYTPEEFEAMIESMSGDFVGIGVYIEEGQEYITIISPIEGSPGQKSGLQAGDTILSVDDIDIRGYSSEQAVTLIKGPAGTTVKLGIQRQDIDETLYFKVTREVIEINPVSYEILEDNIGYIQITKFNGNTYQNIYSALEDLDNKDVTSIIIDLRDNPGGYLDEVLYALELFVPEGPLVHIKENNKNIRTYRSFLEEAKYDLAVLVNQGSASASEIFAAAVQDSGVGTIIGTTTFGKGTVQNIIPLLNGDGIKLTTAEYFSPNMRAINGKGVEPDIIVGDISEDLELDIVTLSFLSSERKPTLNTVGLDVLAAEQVLYALYYNIDEPDGVLDAKTFEAIKLFQLDMGLYSYGVLDYSTQDALIEAIYDYLYEESEKDIQLQKAIEILSSK